MLANESLQKAQFDSQTLDQSDTLNALIVALLYSRNLLHDESESSRNLKFDVIKCTMSNTSLNATVLSTKVQLQKMEKESFIATEREKMQISKRFFFTFIFIFLVENCLFAKRQERKDIIDHYSFLLCEAEKKVIYLYLILI